MNTKMKVYSREDRQISFILLENRTILLTGSIDEKSAEYTIAALLTLDKEGKDPIHLYINSYGGSCYDGIGIIDTMNLIGAPVYTYCVGKAMSMGSAILSSGAKGHRYITPNSTVLIHQASSQTDGNVQDQIITLRETERLNNLLANMIAKNSGKTEKEYKEKTIRDCYMTAKDAIEWGIVDEILSNEDKKED